MVNRIDLDERFDGATFEMVMTEAFETATKTVENGGGPGDFITDVAAGQGIK